MSKAYDDVNISRTAEATSGHKELHEAEALLDSYTWVDVRYYWVPLGGPYMGGLE